MSILPQVSFKNTATGLSKIWTKILNLESSLFPAIQEKLRLEELSHKEQKLVKILDFAQIEKNITVASITNTLKIVRRLRELSFQLFQNPSFFQSYQPLIIKTLKFRDKICIFVSGFTD